MKTNTHLNFVIADDDADDQQLLIQAFNETAINYDLTSVYNGSQLMDYLLCREYYKNKNHPDPDFIFLDINMPLKNGFEVLRELKANNALRNIPVYIFSTSCSPNDQKVMADLGAKKCYVKPASFEGYKKIITEIVAMS